MQNILEDHMGDAIPLLLVEVALRLSLAMDKVNLHWALYLLH